jgi:hypothetical protein
LKSKDQTTKKIAWFSMFCCGLAVFIPLLSISLTILSQIISAIFAIIFARPPSVKFVVIGDWVKKKFIKFHRATVVYNKRMLQKS